MGVIKIDLKDIDLSFMKGITKEMARDMNIISARGEENKIYFYTDKETEVKKSYLGLLFDKKIEFNKLDIAASIIDDYKIFYNQVEKKYREFDKMGLNKSMLVLQSLKKMYIDALLKNKYDNSDLLFVGLIDEVKEIVINSSNYFDISKETLEACASLLVVDAFMRCKIFKNPEGYAYVIT